MANLSTSLNIDVNPFLSSIKQAVNSVSNLTSSIPNVKIDADTTQAQKQIKDLGETAKKTGENVGGAGKTMLGIFGGGALLAGLHGITSGFESLFEKGKEIIGIQESLSTGFKTAGVSAADMDGVLKSNAESIDNLANKYAVEDDTIAAFTATYLKFGGSTENLAKKQEIIIGLSEKAGISYDAAAKALSKASDPEIQGQLTKVGIKFKEGATEAERFAAVNEKIGGTLEGLADKANGPLGQIAKSTNNIGNVAEEVGVGIVTVLAPAFAAVSNVISAIVPPLLAQIQSVFAFISDNSTSVVFVLGLIGTALLTTVVPALFTTATAFAANTVEAIAFGFAAASAGTTAELAGIAAAAAWVAAALPVIGIIAAFAAVGAALVLLYDNFEGFKDIVDSVWLSVKSAFDGLVDVLTGAISSAIDGIGAGFDLVSNAIGSLIGYIDSTYNSLGGLSGVLQIVSNSLQYIAIAGGAYLGYLIGANAQLIVNTAAQIGNNVAQSISTALTWAKEAALVALTVAQNLWAVITTPSIILEVAMNAAKSIGVVVTWAMTAAQWALNVAMEANPIGLLVAGIALLVGGIVYAYNHFEAFKGVINSTWDFLVNLGATVLNFLSYLNPFTLAFRLAYDNIKPFRDIIDNTIGILKNGANAVGDFFSGIGDFFSGGDKKVEIKAELSPEELKKNLNDATKDGAEVKVKLKALDEVGELETSLEKAQDKLKPLQLKIDKGQDLTKEERESYDKLQSKIEITSKKIADAAPDAVSNIKTTVNANGELVQVYEINKDKLGEVVVAQKKAYGEESQKDQKKYSDSLTGLSKQYDAQKQKLIDVKKALDDANAKGDTKGAAKLQDEYKSLQKEVVKTSTAITKGFEDGAKAGLLTDDAAIKVGVSLGKSAQEAVKLSHELYEAGQAAVKASIDAAALGDAFEKAQKNNADAIKDSAKASEGVLFAATALRKEYAAASKKATKDEVEDAQKAALDKFTAASKSAVPIETIKQANELIAKAQKDSLKEQQKANDDARVIETIKLKADMNEKNKEDQKGAKNKLNTVQNGIEDERLAREKAARETLKDETDLNVKLLQINEEANQKKLYAQILSMEETFKLKMKDSKFAASKQDQKADLDAREKINSDALKSFQDTQVKINAEYGKALVKEYDESIKSEDEKAKRRIEISTKAIELIDQRNVTSTNQELIRLSDLNRAKLTLIENQSNAELNELINKNDEIVKIDAVIKASLARNDKEGAQLGISIREDIVRRIFENDSSVQESNRKTQAAIIAVQKANALELETLRLNLIEDRGEREYALALITIQKTLDAELQASRGNDRLRNEAYANAAKARYDLEKDNADAITKLGVAALDGFRSFSDGIAKAIQNASNDAVKGKQEDRKKAQAEYEKETKELETQLSERKISYEEYQIKIAELQDKFNQQMADSATSFGSLFAQGLKDSFQAVADNFTKMTDGIVTKWQEGQNKISQISSALKDAQNRKAQATADGDIAAVAKTTKEIKGLSTEQSDAITANADIATQAYTNMAVAAAASFGSAIAEGGKNLGDFVILALNALESLAPVIGAQIYGLMVASPNPANIATLGATGILAATGLTLGFTALVEVAKAAVRSGQGHHDGGYTGDGNEWQEAGIVHKGEHVFRASVVQPEKQAFAHLETMLNSGIKLSDILSGGLSTTFVTPTGDLLNKGVNYSDPRQNERLKMAEFTASRVVAENRTQSDISNLEGSLKRVERLLEVGNNTIKTRQISEVNLNVQENVAYKVQQQKAALKTLGARG